MSDNDLSSADPFGQIADAFVEAFRQGQRPSVEEFARRYPEHADEIREMLPALVLMEKAKTADDAAHQRHKAKAWAAAVPLQQLGDYQILREVGRGGMGVVYEAQQLSLGRHVAIKVLPSHALLDARQLGRFQREARSAAKLHHTNIVPVFGVGEQDGLHYYVMQFIPGLGLHEVLDELRRVRQLRGKQGPTQGDKPCPPTHVSRDVSAADVARGLLTGEFCQPEPAGALKTAPGEPASGAGLGASTPVRAADSSATIRLPGQTETAALNESDHRYWQSVAHVGVQVASALEYASQQGVLHRDIKPSNLLLDGKGNVWVTDFGLAKGETDGDNLTHTGDIVGTLRYMAPERFNNQGDLRSDVYSLGLTLYELLTLRPAFDEADRNKLIKQVMHDEPLRPRKVNPAVPRDLETVVLKAIARDPAHRYQTPADMADDLQRFVEDRPVRARRISDAEKLWRWCRRNPLPAGLLAGIVLVFSASFAGLWQWRVAEMARADEKNRRNEEEVLRQAAETAHAEATRNAREALEAKENEGAQRQLAEDRAQESRRRLTRMYVANGTRLLDDGDLFGALPWLTEALALDRGDGAREERHRTRIAAVLAQTPRLVHVWQHDHEVEHAAFSPDGLRIVTASRDHTARVWEVGTGRAVTPPLRHGHIVWKAAFSADGGRVVTASHDGTARVWDASNGQPVGPALAHDGPVVDVSFSPDGRWVVTASTDSTARLWDAATGGPRTPPLKHASGLHSAAFSPDGRHVVTGSRQGTAQVWDAATGAPVTPLLQHGRGHIRVAFSPDGRLLATGGGDDDVRLWDAATGEPLGPPLRNRGRVYQLVFSADGRRLATACQDGAVRVWDLPAPDHRPMEDLVLLAQVLSTQRVDANDGLVDIEPAAQRRALEELRSRYPADFAGSVKEALVWHEREAGACLREKNGPAALFHLLHSRWELWLLTH